MNGPFFTVRTHKVLLVQKVAESVFKLRKLAKKIGRNHQLVYECWPFNYICLKVIGLLIDEPDKITVKQVEGLNAGM
jgi:3-methyladenine DNA glycosylase AlkD